MTATYQYDAFGAVKTKTGTGDTAYRFTGELQDPQVARGLYYLRARYYDPALGRFLGRDPFTGFAVDVQSQNRYVYVSNNCVNLVDPSGESGIVPPISGEKIVCTGSGERGFTATNAGPPLFPAPGKLKIFEKILRVLAYGQSEPHRQFTVEGQVRIVIRNREATVNASVMSGDYPTGARPEIQHNIGDDVSFPDSLRRPTGTYVHAPDEYFRVGAYSYQLKSGQYPESVYFQVFADPLLTDWTYMTEGFGVDLECSRH